MNRGRTVVGTETLCISPECVVVDELSTGGGNASHRATESSRNSGFDGSNDRPSPQQGAAAS